MSLKSELKKRNISSVDVQYELQISHTSYFNKLNGKYAFTTEEREKLRQMLEMDEAEIIELIPNVRSIKKPKYPRLESLKLEFQKREIDPVVWGKEHLHIAKDRMCKKLNGTWLFTRDQKEIIQRELHLTDEQIEQMIPVVSKRKGRRCM